MNRRPLRPEYSQLILPHSQHQDEELTRRRFVASVSASTLATGYTWPSCSQAWRLRDRHAAVFTPIPITAS